MEKTSLVAQADSLFSDSTTTASQIRAFIDAHLPNWLVAWMKEYSPDYAYLTSNWSMLCDKGGCRMQYIIIVRDLEFDTTKPGYDSLRTRVAELLTRRGYVVRRDGELQECPVCRRAILSKKVWEFASKIGCPVPKEWSMTCEGCQS